MIKDEFRKYIVWLSEHDCDGLVFIMNIHN